MIILDRHKHTFVSSPLNTSKNAAFKNPKFSVKWNKLVLYHQIRRWHLFFIGFWGIWKLERSLISGVVSCWTSYHPIGFPNNASNTFVRQVTCKGITETIVSNYYYTCEPLDLNSNKNAVVKIAYQLVLSIYSSSWYPLDSSLEDICVLACLQRWHLINCYFLFHVVLMWCTILFLKYKTPLFSNNIKMGIHKKILFITTKKILFREIFYLIKWK